MAMRTNIKRQVIFNRISTMEQTISSIKEFFDNPNVWIILSILGFFGVTDWIKNLIFQYLKETGHNFKEFINDKALRSSFYKWSGKHYKQLPSWAKKPGRFIERIAQKMGFKTRKRNYRRKKTK